MSNNPVKHGSHCRNAFEKWLIEVKDLMFAQRGAWEAWEEAWRQASTERESLALTEDDKLHAIAVLDDALDVAFYNDGMFNAGMDQTRGAESALAALLEQFDIRRKSPEEKA